MEIGRPRMYCQSLGQQEPRTASDNDFHSTRGFPKIKGTMLGVPTYIGL